MFRSKRPELKDFVDPNHNIFRIASSNPLSLKQDLTLSEAMPFLLQSETSVPITDKGILTGILSQRDILNYMGAGPLHRQWQGLDIPLKDIMTRQVHSIQHTENLKRTLSLFKHHGKHSYPITKNKKLKGLITETDFVQQIHKRVRMYVHSAMTKKPIYIKPHYSLDDAAKTLLIFGFRSLPVVKEYSLKGMVTPHDILSYMVKNKIRSLKRNKTQVKLVMQRPAAALMPKNGISSAITLMNLRGMESIPVLDNFSDLVGIITERDIIDLLT